jgi:hypothetical protein
VKQLLSNMVAGLKKFRREPSPIQSEWEEPSGEVGPESSSPPAAMIEAVDYETIPLRWSAVLDQQARSRE